MHSMVFVTRNSLFILFSQEIESQIDRICEMGAVMRRAVQVDDHQFCKVQERLAQLEVRRSRRPSPLSPFILLSSLAVTVPRGSWDMSPLSYLCSVLTFSFLRKCLKKRRKGGRGSPPRGLAWPASHGCPASAPLRCCLSWQC